MRIAAQPECGGMEMRSEDVVAIAIFGVMVLAIARAIDVLALVIDGFLGWILCSILLLFG